MSVPDDVDLDELAKWMNVTGLSLKQLLGREELTTVKEAEVIDEWRRKYVYGRSLCDPTKVKNLGTQMYKLYEYYLRFCAQHQSEQYLGSVEMMSSGYSLVKYTNFSILMLLTNLS
jgi:hypothetical protein